MFGNVRKSLKASLAMLGIIAAIVLTAKMPLGSVETALQVPVAASLVEAATTKAARSVVEQAYHVMSETSVDWLKDELAKTFAGEGLICMNGEPCATINRQMDIIRIVGTDAFEVQPPTAMARWILAVRDAIDELDRCLPTTNPGDCDLQAGQVLMVLGVIPLP